MHWCYSFDRIESVWGHSGRHWYTSDWQCFQQCFFKQNRLILGSFWKGNRLKEAVALTLHGCFTWKQKSMCGERIRATMPLEWKCVKCPFPCHMAINCFRMIDGIKEARMICHDFTQVMVCFRYRGRQTCSCSLVSKYFPHRGFGCLWYQTLNTVHLSRTYPGHIPLFITPHLSPWQVTTQDNCSLCILAPS